MRLPYSCCRASPSWATRAAAQETAHSFTSWSWSWAVSRAFTACRIAPAAACKHAHHFTQSSPEQELRLSGSPNWRRRRRNTPSAKTSSKGLGNLELYLEGSIARHDHKHAVW